MASPSALPSSSTSLWATASKEWVIQPKPKPGRKPKKDAVPQAKADDEEKDMKGRRVQNRAAQRAFRERKQSQLAELQARVQSYEQGEIERNVALQNIAKRLKDENDALRRENLLLKERITRVERDAGLREGDKKRWRESSPSSVLSHGYQRKRSKVNSESPRIISSNLSACYLPSPPSMVSSPDSNETSETNFSPMPYDNHNDNSQTSLTNLLDIVPNGPPHLPHGTAFPSFDCGFCNEDTPCVCRELAAQANAERMGASSDKVGDYTLNQAHNPRSILLDVQSTPAGSSILDNLPAYQPAVPLRRKAVDPSVNPIFEIIPQQTDLRTSPTCSGDPSNCMACADDSFGKAFCAAIEDAVAIQGRCADCPCNNHPEGQDHAACGAGCLCDTPASSHAEQAETIPTNDAWTQLKSHPNVEFADLALLADVVARRSRCSGPRVVISPALGSITPERPGTSASDARQPDGDRGPVLLTDPHAHFREKEKERWRGPGATPPRLVPEETLIRCGRQRIREVHADAVRDALRLLDAKLPHH